MPRCQVCFTYTAVTESLRCAECSEGRPATLAEREEAGVSKARSDAQRRAFREGRHGTHRRRMFTEDQVRSMRQMHANGWSLHEIARVMKTSTGSVNSIIKGRTYTDVL